MSRLALATLAALLVLAGSAGTASAAPRYLGVQVHPLWGTMGHSDVLREVAYLDDLGVNVVRIDIGWSTLQPRGPRQFDAWYVDRIDDFAAVAHEHGIKIIATLTETPCWASTAPPKIRQRCEGAWWDRLVQDYAPRRPADYARAARFLTARYSRDLAALEVWNEPNLSYEFLTPKRNKPAVYAALVRATYRQAKLGSRRPAVLAGSLAYSDVDFLKSVYAAGIAGAHDGIAVHPYSDGRPPFSEVAPPRYEFAAGLRTIRQAQMDAGQPRPLWLTEFGFTACADKACVTPVEQASLIDQTVRAIPALPFVRAATLYQLRDTTHSPREWISNFGLLQNNWTPRPAYAVFKQAVAAVLGSPPRAARSR
jgi:hypothetical protein